MKTALTSPLQKILFGFFENFGPADPRLLEFFADFLLIGGCFLEKTEHSKALRVEKSRLFSVIL